MKILFVYKHDRSFVKQDIEILKKHYDVIPFYFKFSRIFKLWKYLRECDLIFVWFASYHAIVTRLLSRKPMIIVTGGYDVACEKDIGYGLMCKPVISNLVRYTLRKAKAILSVSRFSQKEVKNNVGLDSICIYNAVDSDKFRPEGSKNKYLVITVGGINSETWVRKGFSKFVSLASLCDSKSPEYEFIAIGRIDESVRDKVDDAVKVTSNLRFTGFVSDEELVEWYQKAKIYCQLSHYESCGVAPIEAMLCGCIPIVSKRCDLPNIVGDTGFCVNTMELDRVHNCLIKASKSHDGLKAREYAKNKFSVESREKKLMEVIKNHESSYYW